MIDLRSKQYAEHAPIPDTFESLTVEVYDIESGKAMNHFNKKGKGEFVRALAKDAAVTSSLENVEQLISWAATKNFILEPGEPATQDWPAELNLVVSGVVQNLC